MAIDRTNAPSPEAPRTAEPQNTTAPADAGADIAIQENAAQAHGAERAATHAIQVQQEASEAQTQNNLRNQVAEAVLQEAGFSRGPDGRLSPTDVATVPSAAELALQMAKDKALQGPMVDLGKPMAPPVDVKADSAAQAETFASNFQSALAMATTPPGAAPGTKTVDVSQLSADVLLSAFMKLTILDPGEANQAKNDMAEMISLLNQQGIREAQQQIKNQAEQAKEARQEAAMMKFVRVLVLVITIILVVVLVVAAIFTAGTTLLLLAALLVAVVGIMGAMAASQKEAEAQKDANLAEHGGKRMQAALLEHDNSSEKMLERALERMAADKREELRQQTLVGPDGKPVKNAAGLMKGALMSVMTDIMNIANTQGVDAALSQAGPMIRTAMASKLQEMGVNPPDEIADVIAQEAVNKLKMDTFAGLGSAAASVGAEQGEEAMAQYLQEAGLPPAEAQQVAAAALTNPDTAAQLTAGVLGGVDAGATAEQSLMLAQTLTNGPGDNMEAISNLLANQASSFPAGTRGMAMGLLTSVLGQGQGLIPPGEAASAVGQDQTDINNVLSQLIASQASAGEVLSQWTTQSQTARAGQ